MVFSIILSYFLFNYMRNLTIPVKADR